MPLRNLNPTSNRGQSKNFLFDYIIILLTSISLTWVFSPIINSQEVVILHTILELICSFFAFSLFNVVWQAFDTNSPANNALGFGFLAVALLVLFHLSLNEDLHLFAASHEDLSVWFLLVGDFAIALLLAATSFELFRKPFNKWVGIFLVFTLIGSVSYTVFSFHAAWSSLFPAGHLNPGAKKVFEFVNIVILGIGIYKIKNKLSTNGTISFNHLLQAMLVAIAAEVSFSLQNYESNFYYLLGHSLKITYFYLLFKGVFVRAVKHPYEKLELAVRYTAKLLDGLTSGIITFDNRYQLTYANSRAQHLLGWSIKELQGLSDEEFALKMYGSKKELLIRRLNENLSSIKNVLVKVKRDNGEWINLHLDVQRLENLGYMYLIKEAKKEQELENLQLQTQTILDSITNMVLITDREGKVINCNRALLTAAEISPNLIIGKSLQQISRAFQFTKTEISQGAIGGEGDRDALEATFVTQQGVKKTIVYHMTAIKNVDGELIGHVAVGADITKMKLAQERLQQQEKLAVLGQMAAGLVHEIKNPLTSIKGFSQIMKPALQDVKLKEYLGIIEQEANDVNKVVSDFLAFARPRPPELCNISAKEVIKSMEVMLESQLFMKGIALTLDLAEEDCFILADEGQIKQVILNMVKNAIDAVADVANPQILISCGVGQCLGDVFLSISDNGVGLAREEISSMGTPFYTTKDKGTGLGLSICYQIIKEHGGSISVDSGPGRGTCFTIHLPRAKMAFDSQRTFSKKGGALI